MCNKCGGFQQGGFQPHWNQMSPSFNQLCGPSYVSPAYSRKRCGGYNGSMFVLIVVLFILLIIVGSCKW